MKLVTFQTKAAFRELADKGYLECNEKYIDIDKTGIVYTWVLNKMNESIKNNTANSQYPLWCWVKFKNSICPPKHKGEPVLGFDVKITFHKPEKDVFITDFRRYSFLLNNMYIPDSQKDKILFEEKLKKYHVTKEDLKAFVRPDKFKNHRIDREYLDICKEIEKSFDKCITCESDVLQGCVWRIDESEVEKIEFLHDKNYRYGSFNYVRKNGKRFNWIEDFYAKLQ